MDLNARNLRRFDLQWSPEHDFYNEDEVVVATSAEEYIELSEYYIKNVDKQLPFIEKIQKRIREEYNWYHTWQHILENIE